VTAPPILIPTESTRTKTMKRTKVLAAALGLALGVAYSSARADEAALRAEIAELRAQMAEMKAQMKTLQEQGKATPNASPTTAQTPAPAAPIATNELAVRVDKLEQAASTPALRFGDTTLFSYGEAAYSRPRNNASDTLADLTRAVIGFSHRFDDRTRVAGEFEWEHAVTSADDKGEAAVEQLYVERQFTDRFGGRAGLVLIPLGLLNESHEPTAYYGVFRNAVETRIIPTTWREGGVALFGNTDIGLNWNVGVTTGFDLPKWDPTSDEGRESPLGSIHQELSLARARDLSFYAAANYQGVPGLTAGGGVFTGKAGQGAPNFAAPNARVTLWEGHARWQTGPFDLSALYARGTISDTEALNLTFVGDPTPVPKSFWGAYVQGAWHAWQRGDYSLSPFFRYAWVNTAASYAPMPEGLGVPPSPTEGIFTIGANFYVTPNVVFKADYQNFNVDTMRDRFDLGVGYSF
jgi:hypothetical protein